ncbi:MAG: hypothetical protein LBD90_02155, partial [Bifidobacteriaceae bacterium]|nr:hypothetical protein [Bifidobacteriaceae bacterium]
MTRRHPPGLPALAARALGLPRRSADPGSAVGSAPLGGHPPAHARFPSPARCRARIFAGALALGVGLGLGVQGAQALWYDSLPDWDGFEVNRGQVGFAAARVVDSGGGTPLVDADGKEFSTHGAYADRASIAKSADQGAALSAQLTGDDAKAAATGDIYVQYVVNGLAVGNSRLTYVARLDGKGLAGVTAGAAARLYLVPKDEVDGFSNCENFIKAAEHDGVEPVVSYAGNGAQNDSAGLELVDYPATAGQHIWCLKVARASGQYRNDASIEV